MLQSEDGEDTETQTDQQRSTKAWIDPIGMIMWVFHFLPYTIWFKIISIWIFKQIQFDIFKLICKPSLHFSVQIQSEVIDFYCLT